MFIDFHAHVLHGIDDGARDLSTGLGMLRESLRQGTEYVIATPHFHHGEKTVYDACCARDNAIAEINEYTQLNSLDIPKIIPAFEVDFTTELKNEQCIDKLCICGTNCLLVEMPYAKWTQNDIEALYDLTLLGIKPVVAHVDRYYRHFGESIFSIFELDIYFQLNCKSMETISGRNFVKKIIKSGRTCVIGSDMHNMTNRPCNMEKAYNTASKKLAPYAKELFYTNAWNILFNK